MADKGSVMARLRQAGDRLRWILLVVLMFCLLAYMLMSFLGFALLQFFFVLGGTVDH
ncbi:hypothetical protein [Streptomyces sp. NPDC088731]|uniref:hypothetical protein n=1 Tax=Streptomyces sp. NPDC088731 TaxID=3365878 RepID=UPI003829DC35